MDAFDFKGFAKRAHALTTDEAVKELNTNSVQGLATSEAEHRLSICGLNELPSKPGTPIWKLILQQFDDLMVKILLGAACLSFLMAFGEESEERGRALVEPGVILLILILNAIVGVWQESNAEKAIEALREYEPDNASVTRNGELLTLRAKDLVPGDIIHVHDGDKIPADARVIQIHSTSALVDQSILTGESEPVSKIDNAIRDANAVNQDKKNILFSGTTVSRGKVTAIVVATANNAAIGAIAESVQEEEEVKTPLKIKLDEFGELLSKVISVICLLVWLVNIRNFESHGQGSILKGATYYLKIAVALAVAAIPEGLPAVVTTTLALGTRRMARKNAIIRRLTSVETLGCTTVICSDKTGTLTTNQMCVVRAVTFGKTGAKEYAADGSDFTPSGLVRDENGVKANFEKDAALAEVSKISTLCNGSNVIYNRSTSRFECVGMATEAALKVFAEKLGHPEVDERRDVRENPRALSDYWQSIYDGPWNERGVTLEFTLKGAPEGVLERCTTVLLENGTVVAMNEDLKREILQKVTSFATDALRCLGLAIKNDVDRPDNYDLTNVSSFAEIESGMTFVGLVGMIDPPREEVRGAVEKCRTAGIRVIVITGDNKATAEAICKQIGVFGHHEDLTGKSFTGREFDALNESEKRAAVETASLFSRVEPSHKMELVKLLKDKGEVTAMTGDGVNDAPALKRADIGIGMGSGTAVAKTASDMVLQDDNFNTIVAAVEEGRAIFNNTKAFIRYLISSNIGEVVSIFLTVVIGMPEALVPVQLLWVNLVTDGLPATALSFNPPEPHIMESKPRSSKEGIVNGFLFMRYLVIGVYVGVATVLGYAWWFMFLEEGPQVSFAALTSFHSCDVEQPLFAALKDWGGCSIFEDVRPSTVSLSVLVTIEMFNALNAVSENESLLVMPPWCNPWLIFAIVLSFAQHFAILYVPWLSGVFGVAPLTYNEWVVVIAFSFPVILLDELLKFITRHCLSDKKEKSH